MNAKQRRVARRAMQRRRVGPPILLEAFGRTYATATESRALANRIRVEPITLELEPDASFPLPPGWVEDDAEARRLMGELLSRMAVTPPPPGPDAPLDR